MPDTPTGTVTFLFTDIEGSTRLLRNLGADRYGEALEQHRAILRDAFARNNGHEVDNQGDAFFVAFTRARDAVQAAGEAQRALAALVWPNNSHLRVRMGIHSAEATATREGFVGVGIHRGARICAAGHGGQTLLSHTTHDLIEDEGADFETQDLGEHRLKDLTQPHRLFQLVDPTLPRNFPPLRTLENRPTNLPVQPTPLVGRKREIDEIVDLLRGDGVQLVTLTGPGGTGKTRLALQAAAELIEEFPNGVFFVALAAITDPDLVLPTVARALGVSEASGQSLSAYVATKKLLLVVDNFEQVIAAAPQLSELLGPQAKLLVTSREPLHLMLEHVYPVPPLDLPDPRHLPELQTLSQYESVALFLQRAQAVLPTFEVTTANAPAVAEICVRLDGLPLALELAAARIQLLSPEAMLKRLGERLKLLRSGARDLPTRQQTLRGAVAWSFDLLNEEERQLFAYLGVFTDGFTIEAAEVVCDADLDTLGSLVAKSLVRRNGERLMMLETIREYALECLSVTGAEERTRERHASYFAKLAEVAYEDRLEHEIERSGELEREGDNLRTALDWFAKTDRGGFLRLAGALGWFWHVHSHFSEGRSRLADALGGATNRDEEHARALAAAGELAAWTGDITAAKRLIEESISMWDELGRRQEVAFALHDLGWGYFFTNDDKAARRCLQESLEIQTTFSNPFLVNRAQVGLLQALVSMGELDTVERLAPEALALARHLGDLRSEHFCVHFLADCPLIRGDCESAEERYRHALELAVELGDQCDPAFEIQGIAMAAAGKSQPRRSLLLAGAASAELDALGVDISGTRFWIELLERYLTMAREEIGSEADDLWEKGRRMSFDRAIETALAPEAMS